MLEAKNYYYFKLIMLVAIFLCSENALSFDDKKKKSQLYQKKASTVYVWFKCAAREILQIKL